jgi:hypothetical protein
MSRVGSGRSGVRVRQDISERHGVRMRKNESLKEGHGDRLQ